MNRSRQRDAIVEYLNSTKAHPTADVIYQNVKEEFPKISLATVYRNLTLLVENSAIKKISTGDGFEHYDGDTSPHSHYYCKCCHRIMDVDVIPTAAQVLSASAMGLGTVEDASLMFTGICMECANNKQVQD